MMYPLKAWLFILLCCFGTKSLYVLEIYQVEDSEANGFQVFTQQQVLAQLNQNFAQLTQNQAYFFYRLSGAETPTPQATSETTQPEPTTQQPETENGGNYQEEQGSFEYLPDNTGTDTMKEDLTGKLPDSGTEKNEIIETPYREQTKPDPNQGICQSYGDFPAGEPNVRASIEQRRNYFLGKINEIRQRVGRAPLGRDTVLDKVAQQHSQDMSTSNFFDHTNPRGEGPQQRANRNGFTCPVGENIALSFSVTEGSEDLRKSASHYPNIIDAEYDKVGLGIYDDFTDGSCRVYLTQLFAVPCTPNQFGSFGGNYEEETPAPAQQPQQTPQPQPQPQQTSQPQQQRIPDIPAFQRDVASKIMQSNGYTAIYDTVVSGCLRRWLYTDQSQEIYEYMENVCQIDTTNTFIASIIDMYYDSSAAANIAADHEYTGSTDSSYNYISVAVAEVNGDPGAFTIVIAYDIK